MFETAYAKINLALHVRAREPDGYHRIETIFAFAEDGDRLSVSEGEELSLHLAGRFAADIEPGAENLVLRAAEALRSAFGVTAGAALALDKSLPVAAGLGGGSADAAASMRLLARWWKLDCSLGDLEAIGRGIGADVAACVRSALCRGEGRGDRLIPIADERLRAAPILIVNPLVPVSTRSVFEGWDGRDRGPLGEGAPFAAAIAGRNDLEKPAIALAPAVAEILHALCESGDARLARMSGSGASCFAIYPTDAARDAAAARLARARPDWWQLATRLRHGEGDLHD